MLALANPKRAWRIGIHTLLVTPRVCSILARLGGPSLLARLTVMAMETDSLRAGKPAILVLDRLYFSKDVAELRRRSSIFGYVVADTHILSICQSNWLPLELQEQISYLPRTKPSHDAAWRCADDYARLVIKRAKRRFSITGLLASNVDYWQHESFRRVCPGFGVPFLTLCQELQTVTSVYEGSLKLYRDVGFRYSGAAVAVFGTGTREMLIESGCCAPEQVWITGAPRLDPYFDGRVANARADTITLLAYDGEQYFAPGNYIEALEEFAAASVRYRESGVCFVLKCKDSEDEVRARAHLRGVEHKLEINNARPLTELFPRSRLVFGYNSLALIEALLSPAELAVPQWSDAARAREEQIVDPSCAECRAQFRFVEGRELLRDLLDHAATTPRPPAEREARMVLLRRWFHVPKNGSASEATEKFMLHYVETAAGAGLSRVAA